MIDQRTRGETSCLTPYHGSYALRQHKDLWLPAIPLPMQGMIKVQCHCKRKFRTLEDYEAHYALVHILKDQP